MKYWQKKEASGLAILVTGGAGFLEAHLCKRLLRDGHSVICLDNSHTGTRKNIAGLLIYPNFRFLEADVRTHLYLKVERIFNLACPASPLAYQADPVGTTMTSVFGTHNMLHLAINNDARIMQASTSKAYGDPLEHPQKETYWGHVNPVGPRACYDVGKRCAESLFFDHRHTLDADIKVARIFNTYGGGMRPDDGRVISNFIVEALAEIVIKLTGSKSKTIYLEKPVDDPPCRCPNIDKARKKLGWKPTTTLEQGLTKTITHFNDLLSADRTRGFTRQENRCGIEAELEN